MNGPIDEYGIFNTKPLSSVKSDESGSSSKTQLEDKMEQHFAQYVKVKDTTPVKQETEVSKDKKKMGKMEL